MQTLSVLWSAPVVGLQPPTCDDSNTIQRHEVFAMRKLTVLAAYAILVTRYESYSRLIHLQRPFTSRVIEKTCRLVRITCRNFISFRRIRDN